MGVDRVKVLEAAQKYTEKKMPAKALVEYRKLLAVEPNDARTHLKIADVQVKMEAFEEACKTYEGLAKLYARQGFAPKAIAVYRQMRDLIAKRAPRLEDAYAHIASDLAALYEELGHINDARASYEDAARRLVRQGRDIDAMFIMQKLVALEPSSTMARIRLAEAYSRTGDVDAAVAEFHIAVTQLVDGGLRDDALKVVERLLHHRADPPMALLAAQLYLERGRESDGASALAKLRICFAAAPRDLDVLALLAQAFNVAGQPQRSFEALKERARVARDTGNLECFHSVVTQLVAIAPMDPTVMSLAVQAKVASPAAFHPPPLTPPPHTPTPSMPAPRTTPIPMLVPEGRGPESMRGYSFPPVSVSVASGETPLSSSKWSCPPPIAQRMLTEAPAPIPDVDLLAEAEDTPVTSISVPSLRVSDLPPGSVRAIRLIPSRPPPR